MYEVGEDFLLQTLLRPNARIWDRDDRDPPWHADHQKARILGAGKMRTAGQLFCVCGRPLDGDRLVV